MLTLSPNILLQKFVQIKRTSSKKVKLSPKPLIFQKPKENLRKTSIRQRGMFVVGAFSHRCSLVVAHMPSSFRCVISPCSSLVENHPQGNRTPNKANFSLPSSLVENHPRGNYGLFFTHRSSLVENHPRGNSVL